jgi:cytochrome c556
MGSDDAIHARQDLMRNNISNVKAVGAFLKTGKGSTADVAARARKVAANAEMINGLFPKGTSLKDRPGETRAQPGIWAKPAAFAQAADIMAVYENKLADAADSGDKKAIGAALGQLGKRGCGGCHNDFRGPKPKK